MSCLHELYPQDHLALVETNVVRCSKIATVHRRFSSNNLILRLLRRFKGFDLVGGSDRVLKGVCEEQLEEAAKESLLYSESE